MNIEFEITLRCNAKCPSCSRHCHYGMYGEKSDITQDQVERFASEVSRHGNIDMLWIMGGEPTLHPNFEWICSYLRKTLLMQDRIKRMCVVTNDYVAIASEDITVNISRPEDKQHRCMFVAPCDTGQELKECKVPYDCGVSFGAFGWWPCGAGGAICRLFGLKQYNRKTIPIHEDDFPDRMKMCVLCQAKAKHYMWCKIFGDIKSVSFRKAFRKFDSSKLERY